MTLTEYARGMSGMLIPEIGGAGQSRLARRVENLERFISRFRTQRIVVKTWTGEFRHLEVLCIDGGLASDDPIVPPFYLTLEKVKGKYFVTVSPGVVFDRAVTLTTPFPAIFEPGNLRYSKEEENLGATPPIVAGELRKFEIAVGQSIGIACQVSESGEIGSSKLPQEKWVEILSGVASDKAHGEAKHYQPPVDNLTSEGVPGMHFYRLGVLEEPDKKGGDPKFRTEMAGSNIDHYRERPMIRKAGGQACISQRINHATGEYMFRGLTAGSGVRVTERSTDILIEKIDETQLPDDYYP